MNISVPTQAASYPLPPITGSPSPWSNGRSSWGMQTGAGGLWGSSLVGRTPGSDDYRFTVIPLSAVPNNDVTMQRRADAIAATFSGQLEAAVDLYRQSVEADGWMSGILDTIAHGLLSLPLTFQGDKEMVSALSDADGTAGDFALMHPENECAKIFKDGVSFVGLGQYVLMCWSCHGVEWIRVPAPTEAHVEQEICKKCRVRRQDRRAGARELFQLRWRDPRWLSRDPVSLQWWYQGRTARVPVNAGDGEWFIFQTVPDLDIWRHGPWVWGTMAAIFARDSTFDRQQTSAVCAPTHVFNFKGPADPKTRAMVDEEAKKIAFQTRIVLPGEVEHRIDAAKAEFVDVTAAIVEWASGMWEVGITGNLHGMKSGPGFANMDVYARTTRERRAFYANSWIRQVREQGLIWWGLGNFGTRNVPIGHYDTRSPEDKLAASKADIEEGKAVAELSAGYGAVGHELEPEYIQERAQAKGIRVRPKAGPAAASKLQLGVEATMAVVRGAPALASLGLAPFGDARDELTLAQLAMLPPGPVPPSPAAEGAPAAQPGAGASPPPGAASRVVDEEEEDGDADEDDGARLAAEYTAAGLDRCPYHGRTHACPRCGVRREYGLDPVTHQPRIAWRPARRPGTPGGTPAPSAGQVAQGVLP